MPWRIEAYPRKIVSQYGKHLLGLLLSRLQKPHSEKWNDVTPEEAPLARHALVRAQQLRTGNSDSGDAYLEGWTDAMTAMRTVNEIAAPVDGGGDSYVPKLRMVTGVGDGDEAQPHADGPHDGPPELARVQAPHVI